MKISVDSEQCAGNGSCFEMDEELFPLDEDGYSDVGEGKDVPPGKEDLAQQGVDACPMAALFVDPE
jgi:ferredoxin